MAINRRRFLRNAIKGLAGLVATNAFVSNSNAQVSREIKTDKDHYSDLYLRVILDNESIGVPEKKEYSENEKSCGLGSFTRGIAKYKGNGNYYVEDINNMISIRGYLTEKERKEMLERLNKVKNNALTIQDIPYTYELRLRNLDKKINYNVKFSFTKPEGLSYDDLSLGLNIHSQFGNGFIVDNRIPDSMFKPMLERIERNVKEACK